MSMLAEAVRNNAEWCESMCRSHDLSGVFAERSWTSPRRTPLYYPDAVTLSPGATAADVLDGIDDSPGASIKDSYATLDLPGYDVLFDAQWIHRPAGEAPVASDDKIVWEVVRDAEGVAEWERACFSGELTGLFKPAILDHATLLAGRLDGDIVCGSVLNASGTVVGVSDAVLNASGTVAGVSDAVLNTSDSALDAAGTVVGVSNVFASGCDLDAAWAGTLALAHEVFPGRDLVGYEADVECPVRHGFTPIGPLRIWLKS